VAAAGASVVSGAGVTLGAQPARKLTIMAMASIQYSVFGFISILL
jgi:hypothetical protein